MTYTHQFEQSSTVVKIVSNFLYAQNGRYIVITIMTQRRIQDLTLVGRGLCNFGQHTFRKRSSLYRLVRYISFAYKELVRYTFISNSGYKELFFMVLNSSF